MKMWYFVKLHNVLSFGWRGVHGECCFHVVHIGDCRKKTSPTLSVRGKPTRVRCQTDPRQSPTLMKWVQKYHTQGVYLLYYPHIYIYIMYYNPYIYVTQHDCPPVVSSALPWNSLKPTDRHAVVEVEFEGSTTGSCLAAGGCQRMDIPRWQFLGLVHLLDLVNIQKTDGKDPPFLMGKLWKTHYFDWAIFNSKPLNV